jgi:hypothetical protein
MAITRRKLVVWLFSLFCVVSALGVISIGYSFFNRKAFLLFSAYIVGLCGIVIFFGIKILEMKFPQTDKQP